MYGPHVAQPPGVEPEQPKFERDFIMLSEFSELVGPVPVCIIPDDKAAGTFNTNHFAVRIMSSDFQTASGKLVGPDTQVILSEKQDNAYAYVHYFSCNDINARGYLRQYCFSYVTTSPNKIFDNFDLLLEKFSQVTSLLKGANHRIFQKDMSHYLADLYCTLEILQAEGLSESANVDYSQLYSEYDFTKQDVPERDVSQVLKNMEDTKEILAALKEELEKDESKQVWEDLHLLREKYRERRRKELNSERNNFSDRGSTDGGFTSYLPMSPDSGARMSESLSSSESNEYMPKQVFTHFVNKFERRLRPLEELAPKAHPFAMESIKEIHKHYSRSEFVLAMEKEDAELLDPCSSLLTVGRVPVMNFIQNQSSNMDPVLSYPSRCNSFCYHSPDRKVSSISTLQLPVSLWITSRNTWGLPMQQSPSHLVMDELGAKPGFNTEFIGDKLGLKQFPLYIDPVYFGMRNRRDSVTHTLDDIDFADTSVGPIDDPVPDSEQSGQFLSIPPGSGGTQTASAQYDEDMESRGSTAFATPEGLTPRSSDEEMDGRSDQVTESGSTGGRKKLVGDSNRKDRAANDWKGNDDNGDDDDVCLLPKLNVDSGEEDGGRGIAGLQSRKTQVDGASNHVGLPVPMDQALEASDDSSNRFHSESQSTLTESKGGGDGTSGSSSSREGSISRTGGGGGGRTVGRKSDNGRNSHANGGFTEADGHLNGGMRASPLNDSLTKPTCSSAALVGDPRSALPFSINNSTSEYSRVVSSDSKRETHGFMANNSSYYGSGHRHPAELELEESFATGSGLTNGDPGGTGVGVSAEKLQGALSHAQGSLLGGRRMDVAGIGDDLAPVFWIGQSEGEVEGRGGGGGGGGKGLWGRRRSRQRPLFGLAYRKDKVVPDILFSPTGGSLSSHQAGIVRAGAAPRPPSPGAASIRSNASYPYTMYPSISSGLSSVGSMTSMATECPDTSIYQGPSVVKVIGKANLPLLSTLDHIESSMPFKPGKGILNFCKDIPVVKDLFYCLLHGRPLILLGRQSDENLIRRLIRVLWLFVPGHSSQRQVITWQDVPLDIRDLSRVRLIGLNKSMAPLEPHIKRYVSYWDCTTGKLFTPTYHGDLLTPIVTRTKDKKNEEVFLTHIHSVLLDIAMKAFVYYHGYPAYASNFRTSSSQESSSKKFLTVQERSPNKSKARYLHHQFGIKGGDADIIEYFVDVIREQLSVEWGISQLNGSPSDDGPVRFHLHVKACSESFCCKPKKPY